MWISLPGFLTSDAIHIVTASVHMLRIYLHVRVLAIGLLYFAIFADGFAQFG